MAKIKALKLKRGGNSSVMTLIEPGVHRGAAVSMATELMFECIAV